MEHHPQYRGDSGVSRTRISILLGPGLSASTVPSFHSALGASGHCCFVMGISMIIDSTLSKERVRAEREKSVVSPMITKSTLL